jgi:hypothetical protein
MSDGDHDIEIAGRTVTIRPMCHADAALEQEFMRGLSAESRHYRFLGAVRELTPEEVRQFCDSIDLSDNTHMRMLAADLGMKMSPDPDDAHQVVYSLNLADLPVSAASHAVTSTA